MLVNRPEPRLRALPVALVLLGALAGCADPSPLHPVRGPGPVLVSGAPETVRTDPASLAEAEIRGDRLRLRATFGGGCAEHSFALYRDDSFLESDSVRLRLHLAHDAHGDNCRALLSRDLEFDLTSVRNAFREAYGRSGTILLLLHAPGDPQPIDPPLRYEF